MQQGSSRGGSSSEAERKQTAGIVLQYLRSRGFAKAAEQLQQEAGEKVISVFKRNCYNNEDAFLRVSAEGGSNRNNGN